MSFIISNFNLFFGFIKSNLLFSFVSPENEIKPCIENTFCSSVVKVSLINLSKSYKKKFRMRALTISNLLFLRVF